MIQFGFSLSNPLQKYKWDTIFHKEEIYRKNKGYNVQLVQDTSIIGFDFKWTCRTDHAGISLDLSLFNRTLYLQLYDTRHWDDERGRYAEYNDAGERI